MCYTFVSIFTLYTQIRLIYKANLVRNRLTNQKDILVNISMIDFYLELSYKKKCISFEKMQSLNTCIKVCLFNYYKLKFLMSNRCL